MDATLQQLKDIHLPNAIPMWPPAPGWFILFGLFLGCLFWLATVLYKRKRKYYTVKFALTKLKKLRQINADNPEQINIAAEISTLLRRTALYYFRRDNIAGLSGKDWLNFLNRSGNTTLFSQSIGDLLTDAPYRKDHPTIDMNPLLDLTQHWLVTISKQHGILTEK